MSNLMKHTARAERKRTGIEPEFYMEAPEPPAPVENSGIGQQRYHLYDVPDGSVFAAFFMPLIASKIREQNPPPRSDMPQDEWLRAWGAQVIANAMDGLVTA